MTPSEPETPEVEYGNITYTNNKSMYLNPVELTVIGTTVTNTFTAPEGCTSVIVTITDSDGNVVNTFTFNLEDGETIITGSYSFEATGDLMISSVCVYQTASEAADTSFQYWWVIVALFAAGLFAILTIGERREKEEQA